MLWAVASLTFILFRLMPGDPTLNFLSPTFSEETRAALLRSFGLDQPLWQQYLIYHGQPAAWRSRYVIPARPPGRRRLLAEACRIPSF